MKVGRQGKLEPATRTTNRLSPNIRSHHSHLLVDPTRSIRSTPCLLASTAGICRGRDCWRAGL